MFIKRDKHYLLRNKSWFNFKEFKESQKILKILNSDLK